MHSHIIRHDAAEAPRPRPVQPLSPRDLALVAGGADGRGPTAALPKANDVTLKRGTVG